MRRPTVIAWRVSPKIDRPFWASAILASGVVTCDPNFSLQVPLAQTAASKVTFGTVAAATFGPQGAGFVIIQILLLAVAGWGIHQVACALGHAHLANQAKIVVVLVGFCLVVGVIVRAMNSLSTLFFG